MALSSSKKTAYVKSRKEWRKWLDKNHLSKKNVWLIIYHKKSRTPCVNYDEAVEEALCFGWIDSTTNKRDHESYLRLFAQRKSKSSWSKINRERVDKLIRQGLMTAAGKRLIDLAKKSGTWKAMVDVENSVIPADLQNRLNKNKIALRNFEGFPLFFKKNHSCMDIERQKRRDATTENRENRRTCREEHQGKSLQPIRA